MPPGTMKRVSIRFSRTEPGTSGETSGRRSSETKQAAGSCWFAVYGSTMSVCGGSKARASSRANVGCRHGELVVGDGQPALGDVEDPRRGAAVVGRVVQHAVDEAVAAQQRGGEAVTVDRQRQLAGQAGLVEHQGAVRELRAHPRVGEVVVEEGLDAAVGGTQPVGQPAAELALSREDRAGQPRRLGVL